MSFIDTIKSIFGGKKKKKEKRPDKGAPKEARLTIRDTSSPTAEASLHRELEQAKRREMELQRQLKRMEAERQKAAAESEKEQKTQKEAESSERKALMDGIRSRDNALKEMERQILELTREIKTMQEKKPERDSVEAVIPDMVETAEEQRKLPFGPYTFDNFIIGQNNKFVYTASRAVAQAPADAYNPLFIWGGVGLGKTHLMKSIANYIQHNMDDARVEYTTSEEFSNELIEAVEKASLDEFRAKYRKANILIIDDIQFLAGEERTQEEFFHTFNALYDNHRQIVISSDKPPINIEMLEARLRSRFEGGLITEIKPPDIETRKAILRTEAKKRDIKVEEPVIEFIAKAVNTNIRALKGALNRVFVYAVSNSCDITLELASEVLPGIITRSEDGEAVEEESIRLTSAVKKEAVRQENGQREEDAEDSGVEGGKDSAPDISDLHDEMKRWRLQGYITSRLTRAIEEFEEKGNVVRLRDTFESFRRDVARLEALEVRLKGLENEGFEDDVRMIRLKLLNPEKVSEIEDEIKLLEERVRGKKELLLHEKMEELQRKEKRTRQELESLKDMEKKYTQKKSEE